MATAALWGSRLVAAAAALSRALAVPAALAAALALPLVAGSRLLEALCDAAEAACDDGILCARLEAVRRCNEGKSRVAAASGWAGRTRPTKRRSAATCWPG
jgi:hypothetical protein